ncbi:RQC-minor-1 family DNA-binding protein [Mesobacillus subterraneus]|uniref:RQC-minor-1 family DNA-binding protein n=1 Tax=Mesobacillus subterraneus TaxID=285983 RepID=UPI00273D3EA4|nr:RQC-minor-1 family DNA-binding protein [Mesobacillus subterraneus]WLR54184.1 RQC-minor-1 family DNA-binding protein [Mesobacillus subterraneus]
MNKNSTNLLNEDELTTILLAANEIIMYGGKVLLGKILSGSKDKRIYTADLHHSPMYGAFADIKQKEVIEKVEWVIANGYLTTDERLSLLMYTDKGWDFVKDELAKSIYTEFALAAEFGRYEYVQFILGQHPELKMDLLDLIEERSSKELIDILIEWLELENFKPIPERIREVLQALDKDISHNPHVTHEINSFEANKNWLMIPAEIRQMLVRNVFCGHCKDTVQIEKYVIKTLRDTVVLEGKCKNCGNSVARVID